MLVNLTVDVTEMVHKWLFLESNFDYSIINFLDHRKKSISLLIKLSKSLYMNDKLTLLHYIPMYT